jgi:predicted enzyme related to lactoylglutathione lyase
MSNPIIHFEIPADDVERARAFYTAVFGWKISDPWKMDYFMVETRGKNGDGINGGMMKRKMPGQPFTNYVGVASIDDALTKIMAGGGSLVMPKTEIGTNMGWIAAFLDTEGNIIGLHQSPPGAQPAKKTAAKKTAAKKSAKKAAKKVAKKAVKKVAKKKAKKKAKRR